MIAPQDITALLHQARAGDNQALDRLLPQVYHELRRLAQRHLQQVPAGQTLSATALVHEAYLRLTAGKANWADRAHFFGYSAAVMRNILVDSARRRNAEKRGGGQKAIDLDHAQPGVDAVATSLLALDLALRELERVDRDLARLVELRFFAGLSLEEAVQVTGRSRRSLNRDWQKARSLLHQLMGPDEPPCAS